MAIEIPEFIAKLSVFLRQAPFFREIGQDCDAGLIFAAVSGTGHRQEIKDCP